MRIAIAAAVFFFSVGFSACNRGSTSAPPASPTPKIELGEDILVGSKAGGEPIVTWTIADNGKRCIAAPCPSWTATSSGGVVRELTGIDIDVLELPAGEQDATRQLILSGKAKVAGYFQTIEKAGPAGDATVFFVTSVEGK